MSAHFKGFFSENEVLCYSGLSIYIDKDGLYLIIDHGDIFEEKYVIQANTLAHNFKISVFDESGSKHYLKGKISSGVSRMYLSDNTLINSLLENESLYIYIEEPESPSANYRHTVKKTNLEHIYSVYNGDNTD